MSYIASPLWLLFLATGVILSWQAEMFPSNYFAMAALNEGIRSQARHPFCASFL
jgi:membrane glycosyltransferase